MSTIKSTLPDTYFSTNNQSSNGTAASASTAGAINLGAPTGNAANSATVAESSYLLNLSPEAQDYLKQLGNQSLSDITSSGTSATSGFDHFLLTRDQEQTLNAIIAKYRNAPYTQESFDAMKADIEKAGLSQKVLSAQDQARNFNPTLFLLDALNGTDSTDALNSLTGAGTKPKTSTSTSSADTDTKTTNFLKDILRSWQQISTTMEES